MTSADTTGLVPVTIIGVLAAKDDGPDRRERVSIVLESAADGGTRRLLIGVGDSEAQALAFTLQGATALRPLTYQFMASLVAAAGSAVRSVRVTRRVEHIFYAQVMLRGGTLVDARPSDAINLAATTGAPVFVAANLLEPQPQPQPQGRTR